MAEQDQIDTPQIAVVGVVSAVLLFAIIVGLQVLYHTMIDSERARKDLIARPTDQADRLSRQRARLDGYRWVDESKGDVTIPIERAMSLVVRERRSSSSPSSASKEPADGQ